jgi:hypothetical protein
VVPRCIGPSAFLRGASAVAGGRLAAGLLASALLLPVGPARAQGPAAPGAPPAVGAAPADDPWSGTYEVTGLTVDQRTGDTRRLDGRIVLTRRGDVWKAAAELETEYPTHGGALRSDVIGTGEGRLEGDRLVGTASTQLVMQTAPGVDTDFAYVPRVVGPRLVSDWSARLAPDGTLLVDLSNRGEAGEEYSPTRTTLKGRRVRMPSEQRP